MAEVRHTDAERIQLSSVLRATKLKRETYCREAALRLAAAARQYQLAHGPAALQAWLTTQLTCFRPRQGLRSRELGLRFVVRFDDQDQREVELGWGTTGLDTDLGFSAFVYLATRLCTTHDLWTGRGRNAGPPLPPLSELEAELDAGKEISVVETAP